MNSYIYLLFFAFMISSIQAFCIYNFTEDNSFWVRQMPLNTGGNYTSRFKNENIAPGEKACCHYSTFDCNRNGNKDDMVIMAFQATFAGIAKDYMFTVNLPAGGWLEFHGGGPGVPQINVYNPDGSTFNYEYQLSPRALLLN